MSSYNKTTWDWKSLLLTFILLMIIAGCMNGSDPEGTEKVLREQGYTEIQTQGYRWFAGGRDEHRVTEFTALSPAGYKVTGVVTKSFFRGSTIRLD